MIHQTLLLYRNTFERERMLSRLASYPGLRVQAQRIGSLQGVEEGDGCILFCHDFPSLLKMKQQIPARTLLIFCPQTMKLMCSLLEDERTFVLSITCSETLLEMTLTRFLSPRSGGSWVREHPVPLTHREQQVLTLMVSGQAVDQIARLLGIKKSTVIAHKKHLFAKSGVHSTSQLIVWALFSLYR